MYLMVHTKAYIFDCIMDSGKWACFSLCMDNEDIFECVIPSYVYCMDFEHGRMHQLHIFICGRIYSTICPIEYRVVVISTKFNISLRRSHTIS